jgi:hypothetical protein
LKRKLESARHRYGSVKAITMEDAERLLRACCSCLPTDAELSKWRLVRVDAEKPFTADNATWVKRGGEGQPRAAVNASAPLVEDGASTP